MRILNFISHHSAFFMILATILGFLMPEFADVVLPYLPMVLFFLMFFALLGMNQKQLILQLARAPVWLAELLVMFWMPVYLFWMQQRVYRQHPVVTLLKYLALGMLYFMLVVTAMVLLSLTSLVNA